MDRREMAAAGRLFERGATGRPEIALTFDDGPHPRFTPQVLDVLARHDVVATFFCIGLNAHAYPAVVEQVAAGGHTVANHTWSHPYLPDLSPAEVDDQLGSTNATLGRITGTAPGLVRPPYGALDGAVLRRLAASGLTTVLWDVSASDWARPGAAAIEAGSVGPAGAGSIILMHDGGGDRSQTVAALPGIITGLRARGLRFVTVDRLLSPSADAN